MGDNSARCNRTVGGPLGLCHDKSPALHHMRASDQMDKPILGDFLYVRFPQLG